MNGTCLCGKVRFSVSGEAKLFQYCHCSRCRKITGSAHAANLYIDESQFEWRAGEEYLNRYELSEAKYFANCFCRECGTNMPWKAKVGTTMIIPAGSLDSLLELEPKQSVHWASRAPWYKEPSSLPCFDVLPPKPKE